MSVAVPLDRLLDYSDHERAKWRDWIAADATRGDFPFQDGGRLPTLWSLLDHIFLVERRHLSRLEGATPPDATGVEPGDWSALFEYAALVRADLRRCIRDLNDADADRIIVVTLGAGPGRPRDISYSMTHRVLATHILLHEVRHLAQLAYAVRRAGHEPPGEHDFFYFAGAS